MRRPHMSTGAWIFATAALVLAVGAPISYAAVSSTVAIGNTGNSTTTAAVTTNHQLLTTTIAPSNVIIASGGTDLNDNCYPVYTPPVGKAIVVTSVTYRAISYAGGDEWGFLTTNDCSGTDYDTFASDRAVESQSHVFPVGLPMSNVAVEAHIGGLAVNITGYLIPASQLPSAHSPSAKLPARLADPTK